MDNKTIPNGNISNPEQLGTLIRQVRKRQGITQEDLSSLVGVGPRLIGEIERGKTKRLYYLLVVTEYLLRRIKSWLKLESAVV